jgi:hypothetical protein
MGWPVHGPRAPRGAEQRAAAQQEQHLRDGQEGRALEPEGDRQERLQTRRGQPVERLERGQRQDRGEQPLGHALQHARQPDHRLGGAHEPHDLHLVAPEVEHERRGRGHREDGRQGQRGPDAEPHELEEPLEVGEPLDPLGAPLHLLHACERGQATRQRPGALGGRRARVRRHLDGGGQGVAGQLLDDVGLGAQRVPERLERLALGHVAHALDALGRLDLAQQLVEPGTRGLVLQVDDHAHPLAPLRDGAPEIHREEPEAAQRGERQRDQQDGADAHAPRPAQVPHRLADDEG